MAFSDNSVTASPTDYTVGTGSDITFNTVETEKSGRRRRNTASSPAEPYDLLVRHSVQGSEANDNAVDRHLVQLQTSVHDTAGKLRTMTINITIAKPRSTIYSSTHARQRFNQLVNFLGASGNFDALLRGES